MVADASQLLRQIRHFMTVSWKVLSPISCAPHTFLSLSAFFPLSKSAAWPCGLTSYSPAADPAQTWHQYWGRICQLPQGRKGAWCRRNWAGKFSGDERGVLQVSYFKQAEWNLLKQANRYLLLRFLSLTGSSYQVKDFKPSLR